MIDVGALRELRAGVLRLKWQVAALRFDLFMRRLARDRALKANFNPNQPRVPAGVPEGGQWTEAGWGEGRRRQRPQESPRERVREFSAVRRRIPRVPEPTAGQTFRLVNANARFNAAASKIRQIDPQWRPQTTSAWPTNSTEGRIRHAEARALEAENHLRRVSPGGNQGPAWSEPIGLQTVPPRGFDGPAWIDAYRSLVNSPDLFGRDTWPNKIGTVAVTNVDGLAVFGINSNAPTFSEIDRREAERFRDMVIGSYSQLAPGRSFGRMPGDAFFHAEATVLFRSSRVTGGLAGRKLEVHIDRALCPSCQRVLPSVGQEVGNPIVTYINRHTGRRRTMWNGRWLD